MTQEEKQQLLRDLCGRLPYGVKFNYGGYNGCDYKVELIASTIVNDFPIEDCKPYLRSMSSMTEEEYEELEEISNHYGFAHFEYIDNWRPNYDMTDWLDKNMFDYRGLIPLGLALEAPKGMYN